MMKSLFPLPKLGRESSLKGHQPEVLSAQQKEEGNHASFLSPGLKNSTSDVFLVDPKENFAEMKITNGRFVVPILNIMKLVISVS